MMFTRGCVLHLFPTLLILAGLPLSAGPVHAATEVKVTAEQERPFEDPIQLKIDIECVPTPSNRSGVCRPGSNPAKGSIECERPPVAPKQHDISCVFIGDGTSTFYSGTNGCNGGLREARWTVGVLPGTQLVIAENGGVCDSAFVFDNATIEANINNKP